MLSRMLAFTAHPIFQLLHHFIETIIDFGINSGIQGIESRLQHGILLRGKSA